MEYRKKIRPLRVKLLDGSAKTVLVGINDDNPCKSHFGFLIRLIRLVQTAEH